LGAIVANISGPQFTNQIDRHRWKDLGRKRYLREYVLPLNPVIITDGIEHWPARKKWTLDFFRQQYGGISLAVDGRQLTMGTLIDEVKGSTSEHPAPYLRNHAVKNLPAELHLDVQPMPECVSPNWFDHRLIKTWKDFTYVELYIGGTGAKFPVLHYDGLHTHAFLMQLEGVKEYVAFPPSQSPLMYAGEGDRENKSAVDNVETPDLARFPKFCGARGFRFKLFPGETLFVPSGWWHTARILSPSITVSINGANAANWKDFSRDFRQSYWAGHKAKGALGAAYLGFIGTVMRIAG
jgi:histone arginine demethylase JMJD6